MFFTIDGVTDFFTVTNTKFVYDLAERVVSQREYSANEISTVHTKYNILRITGENRNFNELFEYRTGYIKQRKR